MDKIKVNILLKMYRHRDFLKAVALAIYIKRHTTSSTVKNWTVNKLHEITKLSATTIKKRLPILLNCGLVERQGKNKQHLCFGKMKSSCDRNNIDISAIKADTVKDIENSLLALLVVLIQRQKDYVRLQLQCALDGKTWASVKEARRKRKVYGWRSRFVENGLSYARIARKLGVSIKKAFDTVAFGVRCGFFAKISHFIGIVVKGARNLSEVPQGFTFISKKGNLWRVYANTYQLSPCFNTIGNN